MVRQEYARVRARQAELLGVEPPKLIGKPHAAHVHSMKPGHDQRHKAAAALQVSKLVEQAGNGFVAVAVRQGPGVMESMGVLRCIII
jgi:hypothetical protein